MCSLTDTRRRTFYSQLGEDLLIYRNFINQYTEDGVFLELGAFDGVKLSNTLFFEKELGFSGILIEPVKEAYDRLVVNRPKSTCYNSAISSSESDVELLVNGGVSGIRSHMNKNFIDRWHPNPTTRKVKTDTLSRIFREQQLRYIDLFSLDVEGGELDVLETIDWGSISIYLICIELDTHNPAKNERCRQILRDNGFVFQVKMSINEFWLNPEYDRAGVLFDCSGNETFTGDMDDYGDHVYSNARKSSAAKQSIERCISDFEQRDKVPQVAG